MNKQEIESKLKSVEDNVTHWKKIVQERQRMNSGLSGFFSNNADKEDLYFAENRLRESESELRQLKTALRNL